MAIADPLITADAKTGPTYSLRQLVLYALKLGSIGFGGPVALVGYMHRDLVERRKWISEAEYKEGLTLAQLMPGPLAAQLAIYLGYVHYGVVGATAVGVTFVVPSFLMVLALGWAYVEFGGISWMQAVFYGVGRTADADRDFLHKSGSLCVRQRTGHRAVPVWWRGQGIRLAQ